MFETESAKYADEYCGKCCTEDEYRLCKVDFQRGAELGYAEAKGRKAEITEQTNNTIESLTDEDECIIGRAKGVDTLFAFAAMIETCLRLKTWDILRNSRLFPFLLHRLLLISQGEIPC